MEGAKDDVGEGVSPKQSGPRPTLLVSSQIHILESKSQVPIKKMDKEVNNKS